MENPLSFVKNTRKTYDKFNQIVVTEVQVQFDKRPCMDTVFYIDGYSKVVK